MKSLKKSSCLAFLFALLLTSLVTVSAQAAAPVWMPGFPLRAGAAIIIMWSPVPGASEYKLLKKVDEGEFKEVYKGPVNTFNDTDAPATKTIEYKVRAVIGGKDGDLSVSTILKGVEPIKPPSFTGTIPSTDAITIRWTNPPGSVFFNLYRSDKKDGAYDLLGSFQQETYTDRKLEKGKSYFYRVSAVDRNNTESDKSALIEAKLVEVATAANTKEEWKKPIPKGEFAGEELYEIYQPFDLVYLKSGEIAVVDRTSVQFVDKDGKYLRRLNFEKGWGLASSITVDNDGDLVLTFYGEQLVRKISKDTGKMIWQIKYAPVPGKTNNPTFTAVDKEGNYWTGDSTRYQILKMNSAGKLLDNVGRLAGQYDADHIGELDFPGVVKVYYNPYDGNIYALLGLRAEIKVFDPRTRKGVKTFGGVGSLPPQFQGVGGIGFKKNGNILVYDNMMNVIKEFDKKFEYVASYADIQEKSNYKMSSNLGSCFLYNEDLNRAYIVSYMANKGYIYEMPK